jgi:hypothetical protein
MFLSVHVALIIRTGLRPQNSFSNLNSGKMEIADNVTFFQFANV